MAPPRALDDDEDDGRQVHGYRQRGQQNSDDHADGMMTQFQETFRATITAEPMREADRRHRDNDGDGVVEVGEEAEQRGADDADDPAQDGRESRPR